MPKLRNIGLLLLIAIASQFVIAIVTAITGLPYREAGLLAFGFALTALVIAMLYLAVRVKRANDQAATEMKNFLGLQAEQQALIPKLRECAENIEDKQARSEMLQQLEMIGRSTQSPSVGTLTHETHPDKNSSATTSSL